MTDGPLPGNTVRRLVVLLTAPRSLLIGYALVDTVRSWLRVDRLATQALSERLVIPAPISLLTDSFLILGAVIGLRIKALPGYLISLLCALWVVRDGVHEWIVIASTDGLPIWSWAALRHWWLVGDGVWEALRWLIATAIVAYLLIMAARTHVRGPFVR